MIILKSIDEARSEVKKLRGAGQKIGIVPTMGYLHAGHLSLVRLAQNHCDKVISTIFVNPAQFNDKKDFQNYPTNLPQDFKLLEAQGTHAVFVPNIEMIYQNNFQTYTEVLELSKHHCGATRPGHFRGVSTIVNILFNITQPDLAVFGEKDFQQIRIIERLVEDLKLDIKIIRAPIIREADGLALSSRNVRLSQDNRIQALALSRSLFAAAEAFKNGERRATRLQEIVSKQLQQAAIKTDYVSVVRESDLEFASDQDLQNQQCRILIAGFVGEVRLIDNISLIS